MKIELLFFIDKMLVCFRDKSIKWIVLSGESNWKLLKLFLKTWRSTVDICDTWDVCVKIAVSFLKSSFPKHIWALIYPFLCVMGDTLNILQG